MNGSDIVELKFHAFLTVALDADEWLFVHCGLLFLKQRRVTTGYWAEGDIWMYEGGIRRRMEKITWRVAWRSVLVIEYYYDDEMTEYEMGGACCTYEGEEKCLRGFMGETWRKETAGKPGLDGKVILRRNLKILREVLDWTNLAQDRIKWRAVVKLLL